MTMRLLGVVAVVSLMMAACSSGPPASGSSSDAGLDQTAASLPPPFINRVWVVAESAQVARGELRVFLSEGTLVMASEHGTPSLGSWRYADDRLTIVEDGISYDVDILELDADVFRIRIHSPGDPVDIRFAPAETPALSQSSTFE